MNATPVLLGPLVGGLTHQSANLWARCQGKTVLYAWIGQKPDLSDARLAGKSPLLDGHTGFAGIVPVSGLQAETRYYYTLTTSKQNPPPDEYPSFTTFPLPSEKRPFTFVFGSCFRPGDENGGEIFAVIDEWRQKENFAFMLMIGDQIYADAWKHNGIGKIAVSKDEYRRVYAYTWTRPALRRLFPNLPVFMTLDDHEVDDDWHWLDAERRWATIPFYNRWERILRGFKPQECYLPLHRVRDALQVYWEHQLMHAPPLLKAPRLNYASQYELREDDRGSLAYTFTHGAAAFFVMDTRTMRVHNQSILGEGQWQTLETWLLEVKDYPVKFLVTSSALLFDFFGDVTGDRWSGFKRERDRLLYLLAREGIENVYILTGDLHSGHAISANLRGPNRQAIPIWEFCASPFEQKTNWLSKLLFVPIRSGAVSGEKLYFVRKAYNFGVVRVHFDEAQKPIVRFELVYKDKKSGRWLSTEPVG